MASRDFLDHEPIVREEPKNYIDGNSDAYVVPAVQAISQDISAHPELPGIMVRRTVFSDGSTQIFHENISESSTVRMSRMPAVGIDRASMSDTSIDGMSISMDHMDNKMRQMERFIRERQNENRRALWRPPAELQVTPESKPSLGRRIWNILKKDIAP